MPQVENRMNITVVFFSHEHGGLNVNNNSKCKQSTDSFMGESCMKHSVYDLYTNCLWPFTKVKYKYTQRCQEAKMMTTCAVLKYFFAHSQGLESRSDK